jgi:colicin import membrane protein
LEAKRRAELEARRKEEAETARKAEAKNLAALELKREMEAEVRRKAALEAKQQNEARKQAEEENLRLQQAKQKLQEQLEEEQQAESSKVAASAARDAARYWILNKIKPKVEKYSASRSGKSCTVRVSLRVGGEVDNVTIIQSSGDDGFDQSVQAAVLKASPLPWPDDKKVADELKTFSLIVKSK